MRNLFLNVFENYLDFYRDPNAPGARDVKRLLKYDIPEEMNSFLQLDREKYLVTGSSGVGNPTETPWIAIFDRGITVSAQRGFYVVILFRKDMQGFYLSLNQGTTYLREKFKGHKPIQKMKEVAFELENTLGLQTFDNLVPSINLTSLQQNAKAYEAANIQAKYYDRHSFPNDDELASDIDAMLSNLERIKQFIGTRSLDQVIDELIYREEISDVKFQEDVLISTPASTPKEPQPVRNKTTGVSAKERFTRDSKIAKEALEIADYKCEVDPIHLTFISPLTKRNFVEAHHLIPISNQANFNYSLDVPGNIISLCPNCHREIHHGTSYNKRILVSSLYGQRKDKLSTFGIDEKLENILKMYIA